MVEGKKFFTSGTERIYDAGKKPTKAEKKEKEEKGIKLKKQKLEKMGHPSKTVKQEKEELAKTDVNVPGDEDMLMLISDDDNIGEKEGIEKKFTSKKPSLQKCHNDNDVSDKEGTEKKFTTKKPPSWKSPHK